MSRDSRCVPYNVAPFQLEVWFRRCPSHFMPEHLSLLGRWVLLYSPLKPMKDVSFVAFKVLLFCPVDHQPYSPCFDDSNFLSPLHVLHSCTVYFDLSIACLVVGSNHESEIMFIRAALVHPPWSLAVYSRLPVGDSPSHRFMHGTLTKHKRPLIDTNRARQCVH